MHPIRRRAWRPLQGVHILFRHLSGTCLPSAACLSFPGALVKRLIWFNMFALQKNSVTLQIATWNPAGKADPRCQGGCFPGYVVPTQGGAAGPLPGLSLWGGAVLGHHPAACIPGPPGPLPHCAGVQTPSFPNSGKTPAPAWAPVVTPGPHAELLPSGPDKVEPMVAPQR